MIEIDNLKNQITILKLKLAKTDYKAIKFAEGAISATDYEPIRQQRWLWREQINLYEEKIKILEANNGNK